MTPWTWPAVCRLPWLFRPLTPLVFSGIVGAFRGTLTALQVRDGLGMAMEYWGANTRSKAESKYRWQIHMVACKLGKRRARARAETVWRGSKRSPRGPGQTKKPPTPKRGGGSPDPAGQWRESFFHSKQTEVTSTALAVSAVAFSASLAHAVFSDPEPEPWWRWTGHLHRYLSGIEFG